MFSKKGNKKFIIFYIIFIFLYLIVSLLVYRHYADNYIDITENPLFQLTVKILGMIIIFIPIIYFVFIKLIYFQYKLFKMEKFILNKQYKELDKLANEMQNKIKNPISEAIYCINLTFQKKYNNMINYFDQNSLINIEATIYYILTKFILELNIDASTIKKTKNIIKVTSMSYSIPLIDKINLLENKDYSAVLNIKSNKDIDKNEFFLFTFNLCELKAKKELNLDYSEEQKFLDNSHFKIDTPLN